MVLTANGTVPDLVSYALGLRDHAVLEGMIDQFMNEEDVKPRRQPHVHLRRDHGRVAEMAPAADFYTYDERTKVWVDKTGDEEVHELVDAGEELKIVGIVQPRRTRRPRRFHGHLLHARADAPSDRAGLRGPPSCREQLNYPTIDVFNGKEFTEEEESGSVSLWRTCSASTRRCRTPSKFDESKLNMDTSALGEGMSASDLPAMPGLDASALNLDMTSAFNSDAMGEMMGARWPATPRPSGAAYAQAAASGTPPGLPDAGAVDAGVLRPKPRAAGHYGAVRGADRRRQRPAEGDGDEDLRSPGVFHESLHGAGHGHDHRQDPGLGAEGDGRHGGEHSFGHVRGYRRFPERLPNEDDRRGSLSELIMSLMTNGTRSFDANLSKLGYAELSKPLADRHLPDNFEDKQQVIAILDDYNDRMVASGQDDKKVSYTDFVGTLMKSVTTIVDMISYVLIAFVAISLVVSSIMIGIITYISVLERKKEIGILRAIGASKRATSRGCSTPRPSSRA